MRKLIAGIILGTALLCGTKAHAQYNREYFFWVGRSCMMNNDYQEAIRTLNTLLRFDEDAFEGYFLRGIAKYNLDDLLGAEDDFSTAIRLNPVYTQAYTYRAITRSRLGNYDDALQDFREAIELRPDLPGPYYSRGVTRLLNQQFKEAIDDFDKFIRQENKVADAFICRGLSYLHLKDTTRAYENFNTAIRTNRENPNGYNRRGGLHLQQEQYKEAEADFNKAIECDSAYLLSYFNRALVYNATNRPMQALADFDNQVKSFVLDADGVKTETPSKEVFAMLATNQNIRDNYDAKRLILFQTEDGRVVIPLIGMGLWGDIWGYVALEKDMDTVSGIVMAHKGETPGLGAEIATPKFQAHFAGKKLFKSGEFVSVSLRKGGAKDPEHEVDGISGGTKTSDGVTAMLRDCLSAYLPYFESQHQAAAQSAPAAANEAASSEVSNQQNVNESHE